MDISTILKAKQAWHQFNDNHPKFGPFVDAVKARGVSEGSIIAVEIKYPDGSTMKTNLKVCESDIEALNLATSLIRNH